MSNTSGDTFTEPAPVTTTGFPIEQVTANQNKLITDFDIVLKKLEQDTTSTKKLLQTIIDQNKPKEGLNAILESQTKTDEKTDRTLNKLSDQSAVLAKTIENLNVTLSAQNKKVDPKQARYESKKTQIEEKYAEYKEDSGLLGTLFPKAFGKVMDRLRDEEIKKLKKAYPEETAKEELKKETAEATQTTQAAKIESTGNTTTVAKAPETKEENTGETEITKKLQESKPETLRTEEKPLKIEIVDINEKVLEKLKDILGSPKSAAKEEPESEQGNGLLDVLSAVGRRGKAIGGALLRGSGRIINKAGRAITSKAKSGGLLSKAGQGLRTVGGKIASGGAALAKSATTVAPKAATAVASTAAKTTATTTAKTIGKSVLKKLPIIGALAGGVFAAQRAIAGDFTGAGLELASGGASLIPGIGTAASIGIDAALLARDIKRAQQPAVEPLTSTSSITKPQGTEQVQGTSALKETTKTPEVEVKGVPPTEKMVEIPVTKTESKPLTQITPATATPSTVVAATPTSTETKTTSPVDPELNKNLGDLIKLMSAEKEDEAAVNANVANSNANTTIINNTQTGGEDTITSLRMKTYYYISDRRRLA